MPKVFISYRRNDSIDIAGRIHDSLVLHLGSDCVYMDVEDIPRGVDFREHIVAAVCRCDAVLMIIGDHWLEALCTDGPVGSMRRLDAPQDFVRIELETALKHSI